MPSGPLAARPVGRYRLAMLRRLLGWLGTRPQTHLFLARDLSLNVAPQSSHAASLTRVVSTQDTHFPDLAQFCAAAGFGADWSSDMLGDPAAVAHIARDGADGAPMAMAWSTVHPFHVEEIHA